MSVFSENLTYYRKLAGLNQNQLAEKIGITPAQVSRYERDMAEPRPDVLVKIASVLNVKIEDLIPIPKLETPYKRAGELISSRMNELEISENELAKNLGVHKQLIEAIVDGRIKGAPRLLKQIMDYLRISIDEITNATENILVDLDDSTNKVKLLIDLDSNGNCVTFSQVIEEIGLINGVTELLKSYISQNNNNMPSISNIDEFELKSISVNFQKKE